jgi:hypothetical protein
MSDTKPTKALKTDVPFDEAIRRAMLVKPEAKPKKAIKKERKRK